MPYVELILGAGVLMQGLVMLSAPRKTHLRLLSGLSILTFFVSGGVLIYSFLELPKAFVWFGLLEDNALLRLPRAALIFAALLMSRVVIFTKELPQERKPEVLFILGLIVLFCDLLILSKHMLLSCILLTFISWFGLFLSGLAFRGRLEGEAVLKFWIHVSLSGAVGFASLLIVIPLAGGAAFDSVASFVSSRAPYSGQTLLVALSLFLPYFLAGGVFPFHFFSLDRDEGIPWVVQLVLAVLVQGTICISLWKAGVEVFGAARPSSVADGMRLVQWSGLMGGFWLVFFALTQNRAKKLFSALMGAQWFAILGAGALPSVLGLSAICYAFSGVFLWGALLGFTWSRMQEASGGEQISSVYGMARVFRAAGLSLLLALAAPLCVPGFSGFATVLYLIAATIEQKSLLLIFAEGGLLALIFAICLRVGTDLLFRNPIVSKGVGDRLRYGALDVGAIGLVGSCLLVLGFLWHLILPLLAETAKVFI